MWMQMQSHQNACPSLVAAQLLKKLAVAYKGKYTPSPWSTLSLRSVYPRKRKTHTHGDSGMNVHISFIHNNKNWEMLMAIIRKMDEKMVVYSYNKLYFLSIHMNELLIHTAVWLELKTCWAEEARRQRVHTASFHVCELLEHETNLWWQKSKQSLPMESGHWLKGGVSELSRGWGML